MGCKHDWNIKEGTGIFQKGDRELIAMHGVGQKICKKCGKEIDYVVPTRDRTGGKE